MSMTFIRILEREFVITIVEMEMSMEILIIFLKILLFDTKIQFNNLTFRLKTSYAKLYHCIMYNINISATIKI
jgi:hypothetical protein